MDFRTIVYEVERGRARITLNRPERLNALSGELQRELNSAMLEADNDTRVHAVILRGAGRAFSAGYDLLPGPRGPAPAPAEGEPVYRGYSTIEDDSWQMERALTLRMAIFDLHKPVLAQVHGYCLAGGADLALLCDIVVVAEDATIGFPPVRAMGSPPNHMWAYMVGPQWAKRLLLTGDTISGGEAAQIGFALKAVPADQLEAEVEGLADRMAKIDTDLLSSNKRIVNLALELMGARTMQRLAAENDARAHRSAAVREFGKRVGEGGLRSALEWRDSGFGDGRARVGGAEVRDERGRLL